MYDTDSEPTEYPYRAHIRKLLLNYFTTHITTDYIQLTEQAVADVSTLAEVLLLPTDVVKL
jgi:hypothetical protein